MYLLALFRMLKLKKEKEKKHFKPLKMFTSQPLLPQSNIYLEMLYLSSDS